MAYACAADQGGRWEPSDELWNGVSPLAAAGSEGVGASAAAAPGATLAAAGWAPQADERRGLDHGAWVPLMHLFPQADVPAFQVSLPSRLDAGRTWAFGQALAPLAEEGVLIVGSGSLTHNLVEFRAGHGNDDAYVASFADWVREAVEQGDGARLRRTLDDAPAARRAHPTPEHFWPLLVAAGAADTAGGLAPATVIEGGIAHGMLARDSYAFGAIGAGP